MGYMGTAARSTIARPYGARRMGVTGIRGKRHAEDRDPILSAQHGQIYTGDYWRKSDEAYEQVFASNEKGQSSQSVWHLGVVGVDPSEQGKGMLHLPTETLSNVITRQVICLA